MLVVFASQGALGLALLIAMTARRMHEPQAIAAALGESFIPLVLILFAFSLSLGLLKFSLTDVVFVAFSLTALTITIPILGLVVSAWLGVLAAVLARLVSTMQVVKRKDADPLVEYVKVWGQFGTYGIPVVVAALVYEWSGGHAPILEATLASAGRIALCGLALQLTNCAVMANVERAYGYAARTIPILLLVDLLVFLTTLPFAVLVAVSVPSLRWPGLLGWSGVGVLINLIARKLAVERSASRDLVKRLSSLTNVGRTIALNVSTMDLMISVYEACKEVVDVSFFTIALLDETANELRLEYDIRADVLQPKTRIPLGAGLTSYVVLQRQPLLLRTASEERKLGLSSVMADEEPTESWLGVPMIARNHVVGAIVVQSYERHQFTRDDVVLLTAIANQAAIALANARLYQDLEGLTFALEQRVADRTSELRETNVRLVAADRSKSQFLANMSHELRTPLNSIIGFSAILLKTSKAVLEPRFYRFLENINTAGSYLLNLINDILDLSKIEAGKLRVNFETFDLRETITSVERVMKGTAQDSQISIVTSIDPQVTSACLDEARLKQVLFNLLSNAVKFSPAGSIVQLKVTQMPANVSPLGRESVSFVVSDHGIGISQSEIPKIFDHFHQTDEGRKFGKQGTGLGLSLTKSFTEILGGRIEVQSERGVGSTFTVHLPLEGVAEPLTRPSATALGKILS
ncbi:MAG TPA: ATP-binding protein [Thermoanaerobaculia bacterium]|nr:ATP-binding protein [Thermoanaerobaculia bacterium]